MGKEQTKHSLSPTVKPVIPKVKGDQDLPLLNKIPYYYNIILPYSKFILFFKFSYSKTDLFVTLWCTILWLLTQLQFSASNSSNIFFCIILFLLSFWDFSVSPYIADPQFSEAVTIFFCYHFPLYCSNWKISIDLSSSVTILSSPFGYWIHPVSVSLLYFSVSIFFLFHFINLLFLCWYF